VASIAQVTPTPSAGGDTFNEGANKKLVKFPNGLEYADVKVGKGKLVSTGDTVELDYTLFGSNGKLVQTTKGGTPFQATLDSSSGLITGFVQGVTGMHVGGVRRIVIPPGSLSFPSSGWPSGIPTNSDVIFIVTVRSIVPTPSPTPTP
jgi:peptidylprolyl isomerase